jgi:hypothetical protein
MATHIREQIAEKVRFFNFYLNTVNLYDILYHIQLQGRVFALMADETRDVSGHEQLSIVVRVVSDEAVPNKSTDCHSNDSVVLNEYFIGLVKLDEFDAQTLADEIVQYLSTLNIQLDRCVAMCFDG